MHTNDREITELMRDVDSGKAQLPDFQRGWVWDDNRIKALIESVTSNFPVGAAMFLEYGNDDIHFKYKTVSDWLSENPDKIERVIFNVFKDEDKTIYEKLI